MWMFKGLTHLSFGGMFLTILYFGGSLIFAEEMTKGNLMSYLMSTQSLQRSLGLSFFVFPWSWFHLNSPEFIFAKASLVVLYGKINRAIGAGSRVFSFIKLPPHKPLKGGKSMAHIEGEIIFDNVNFEYPTRPDQPILHGFNLHVPSGKIVALCGSSGSGKSTLAFVNPFQPFQLFALQFSQLFSTLPPSLSSWSKDFMSPLEEISTLMAILFLSSMQGFPSFSWLALYFFGEYFLELILLVG